MNGGGVVGSQEINNNTEIKFILIQIHKCPKKHRYEVT